MEGSPSELRVEVTVLKVDNLPLIRKLVRTERQFFITATFQGVAKKLASAKFDGQFVKWNKAFDAFFVRPSSPFSLQLYAGQFLDRDILVGKTQEMIPSIGSSDLDLYLTEGQTQHVVLHLKVVVSPSAASVINAPNTATFPANYTNNMVANLGSSPYLPASPITEDSDSIWTYGSSECMASRRSSLLLYTDSTIAVNEESSSGCPSNSTDRVVANPRSSPRLATNPIPVDEESSTSWPSIPTDRITDHRPSSRLATNPIALNVVPSSSWPPNSTGRITASPRSSARLTTNPISANEGSSSSRPSNPTDHIAANPRSSPRFAANSIPVKEESSSGGPSNPTDRTEASPTTPGFEPDIDDIIQTVQRFRILSVGRSGVGKSSLINRVFGIEAAQVQNHRLGEADIQREFLSPQSEYFVLHDSEGFEPGDLSNFETVSKFVQQRSRPEVPLSERIHGLWLCTETPTCGGRVFETGDEKLLQFAHKYQVPMVIVFTQYDRLVRTKEAELQEEYPNMDQARVKEMGREDAQEAFNTCLKSLQRTMNHLRIPMPRYARVSVLPGHREDISELVTTTRDIVRERVKGDAWVMWAVAQRASLSVKIDACVAKGISYSGWALTGIVPGFGMSLFRDCLGKVHKDIVTCWNFRGEVLNSRQFQQLMLRLVQDVYTGSSAASWLPTTVLQNVPEVKRLLIAYIVDLIKVLIELFNITIRPELALTATWTELQAAFEVYEKSSSCQRIHERIRSETWRGEQLLVADDINRKVLELLRE